MFPNFTPRHPAPRSIGAAVSVWSTRERYTGDLLSRGLVQGLFSFPYKTRWIYRICQSGRSATVGG